MKLSNRQKYINRKNRAYRLRRLWAWLGPRLGWAALITWEAAAIPVYLAAESHRTNGGIGGELAWPFIPLLVWLAWDCAMQIKKLWEGERNGR